MSTSLPHSPDSSPSRPLPDDAKTAFLIERLLRLAGRGLGASAAVTALLGDVVDTLRILEEAGRLDQAGALAAAAKNLRTATRDLDLVRAKIFAGLGNPLAAKEALKEELRYFPDNEPARAMLAALEAGMPGGIPELDPDLAAILPIIQPYTMVGLPRLASLFYLAKRACQRDIPGDFAECGVAAGGTSALLAYAIKQYSQRPRRLYCFDTFSGMPDPSPQDLHAGQEANATGWGAGTCAAPEASLREVCRRLGVEDLIAPFPGLFKDTLPVVAPTMTGLALLHMDGDWYESTRDILVNLYDLVAADALIQVDDYGYWEGCDQALAEFFAKRQEHMALRRIPGGVGAVLAKSGTKRSGS
ncbi:TylF/MycF/NovP-related O-methyltransferase [Desulfovibrio sp. TomC]|uniref:TylF/MycF/NovP-related O-methyltransferase n=1 Tax=Desulfovibrio sp. TomC TaxID=1562888 RepID=UPI000575CD33|nr:TylF/MycF/NovP-related O-methyltransferase [Desulfovibrio sp. TomC]KHK02921.1 macrocin-O-methyltransferase domain protein [Desulfovibrio sp. TomC]